MNERTLLSMTMRLHTWKKAGQGRRFTGPANFFSMPVWGNIPQDFSNAKSVEIIRTLSKLGIAAGSQTVCQKQTI